MRLTIGLGLFALAAWANVPVVVCVQEPAAVPTASSSTWAIQRTPNSHGPNGQLSSVSCTSASSCTAVGWYENDQQYPEPLAESRHGNQWSPEVVPAPTGALGSQFYGVSCPTPTFCMAVGVTRPSSSRGSAFAETWDDGTWAIAPAVDPSGAAFTTLYGAACTSPDSCVAVGEFSTTSTTSVFQAMTQTWDGSSWTVSSTPLPAAAIRSELVSVSCPTSMACTTVGTYVTSSEGEIGLAEAWDGTNWAFEPTPVPRAGG